MPVRTTLAQSIERSTISRKCVRCNSEHESSNTRHSFLIARRMPVELHHLNDEVPGSSPGGSNMRGHSSMVEHEVSSKTCRRAFSLEIDSLNERPLQFRRRSRPTWNRAESLLERIERELSRGKLLKGNGGGDRSRTCIALRPAVFKTAAIPLCDPSALTPIELYRRRRRWLNPHLR